MPLPRYVCLSPIYQLVLIAVDALLGLPAFKPGEKIELDFGMDDI